MWDAAKARAGAAPAPQPSGRAGFSAAVAGWALVALVVLFGPHGCSPAGLSAQIGRTAQAALAAKGLDYVTVKTNGQTVALSGVTASPEAKAAAGSIAFAAAGPGGVWSGGVTRVDNRIIVAAPVSPFTWSATRDGADGVRLGGHAPSAEVRAALAARAHALFKSVTDETATAPGAPPGSGWREAAEGALGQLSTLSRGSVRLSDSSLTILGEADAKTAAAVRAFYAGKPPGGFASLVDISAPGEGLAVPGVAGVSLGPNAAAADCQKAFAGLLKRNVVNFDTGSATIAPASLGLLDDLARVGRRCDQYTIEIAGHTDDRGERELNIQLSRERAGAVVRYLVGRGVSPDRLESRGFGADRPLASNRTPAGQARNRRIEFTVKS